jgi:hypothetical protein
MMRATVSFTLNDGMAEVPPVELEGRNLHDLFGQIFDEVRGDSVRPPESLAGAKLEVSFHD